MRIPFGKFRGRAIVDLPDDYLRWLSARPDLRDPLKTAVQVELDAREFARAQTAPPCPAPELAQELIGAGLRTLARRRHPDAGGKHEDMVALNACAEWLRERARGAS